MSDADLDRSYTALCHALGDVGAQRSELLLAMVALALLARMPEAGEVMAIVARSRERCLRGGPVPHDLDQAEPGSPS
jgi:hypothetical protein